MLFVFRFDCGLGDSSQYGVYLMLHFYFLCVQKVKCLKWKQTSVGARNGM